MALKVPNLNKQGPTARRKYITITVPQKREISRLECSESGNVVMSLYNI
jgi:hypothetical protein